jgi:glutamyl-tRNA synthetase
MPSNVVTRFAPSPTGFMHIGGVRTALYAYLWAKKNNGTFILRIEDTDKNREVEGSIDHIMESLRWIGIEWDEGPDKGGPNAPYIQSQRLESYKKYAQVLIDKGLAYPDPYSKEELEEFRKKADSEKRAFLYRDHRPTEFGIWDGTKALRFKTPTIKSYTWTDAVRGELSAGPEALDDFILIKSDGYPTYNFAHIIDDLEMKVTHVMRADEFISSTPKFLSLYEALEITPPILATMPPILAAGGNKKLGKRDGAKDILEYRTEGYLPEAMMNFLALLGWNPGGEKEVFTEKELIELFTLEKIQHSGGQFGDDKLDWLNKEHLKLLPKEVLEKNILAWLPEKMQNEIAPKIIPLILERISKYGDIKDMVERGELDFFFEAPNYDKEKLIFKNSTGEKTKNNLGLVINALQNISENDFGIEKVKTVLMDIADKSESRGEVLHPVRYALSGLDKSPDPFTICTILGKNETLQRLQKAI